MEEPDKTMLWIQSNGERRNQRIRKVGMTLSATLPFTFSQICHEWNRSKIVRPYLDALYVSRVDVCEIGGPPNESTDRM